MKWLCHLATAEVSRKSQEDSTISERDHKWRERASQRSSDVMAMEADAGAKIPSRKALPPIGLGASFRGSFNREES